MVNRAMLTLMIRNERLLLQLCCNNTLCNMNTFFQHRFAKCT